MGDGAADEQFGINLIQGNFIVKDNNRRSKRCSDRVKGNIPVLDISCLDDFSAPVNFRIGSGVIGIQSTRIIGESMGTFVRLKSISSVRDREVKYSVFQ